MHSSCCNSPRPGDARRARRRSVAVALMARVARAQRCPELVLFQAVQAARTPQSMQIRHVGRLWGLAQSARWPGWKCCRCQGTRKPLNGSNGSGLFPPHGFVLIGAGRVAPGRRSLFKGHRRFAQALDLVSEFQDMRGLFPRRRLDRRNHNGPTKALRECPLFVLQLKRRLRHAIGRD